MYHQEHSQRRQPYSNGSRNRFGGRNSRPRFNRFRGTYIGHDKYISKAKLENEVNIYTPDSTFDDFGLVPALTANIKSLGYTGPTQIQSQTIPHIMQGKDLLGLSSTGSGKTAAFLIPLVNKTLLDKSQRSLIIAPTRELAVQIQQELKKFTNNMNIRHVVIIGGASIRDQISILRNNPAFVIATPGRLLDLYDRNCVDLGRFTNVVLDEVDQMLDMGFVNDIKFVVSKLSPSKQALFFSATINREAENISNSLLKNPVRIEAETRSALNNIDQDIVRIGSNNKVDLLHDLLVKTEFEKVLIFSRTKRGADDISYELQRRGFKSEALHGNKSLGQRSKVLTSFKQSKINILVATDVAARGIDVPDISHVINFDEPDNFDTYKHRIGRTGRIGKKGVALTFVR